MPSISERRIILIDIQRLESDPKPNEFRSKLLIALSITDSEWDLEWECIKRQLTPVQKIIGNMVLMGYKQWEMGRILDVTQQGISYQWLLVIQKIRKLYDL